LEQIGKGKHSFRVSEASFMLLEKAARTTTIPRGNASLGIVFLLKITVRSDFSPSVLAHTTPGRPKINKKKAFLEDRFRFVPVRP